MKDRSISHNIFRMQGNKSVMCGFYCIAFIEYMVAGKTLLDYTNLISPNDYKKNDGMTIRILKIYMAEENYKKTCKYLNYALTVTSSVFAFLVAISVGITSSAVGMKICAITTAIKKYKLIIKKQEEV